MKEFKRVVKKYYKTLVVIVILGIILNIKFPYYIDTPGGISNIKDKIKLDGYEMNGSINSTYISEYQLTIPSLFIKLFNKDSKIIPYKKVLLDNESTIDYETRDKLFMNEAISNAIYIGYKNSNSKIRIKKSHIYVSYVTSDAETNLKLKDEILKINNVDINSKEDINKIIENKNVGDKLNIEVESNKKIESKYAYVIELDGDKKLGIIPSIINDYEMKPNIEISLDKNETGPSSGFIMALFIYNSLTHEDITKGRKIVGTGTIDLDGNIGKIDGVDFKLKSAVKSNADIFLVPKDENYKEAIKLKKKNNYNIEIKGISTFEEAIEYLKY